MKEIFKELIADFHTSTLPKPFRRELDLPSLPEEIHKAYVLIGMRRSGKTWSLYQIMEDLISDGLDLSKILYFNFEDDRLSGMRQENFQDILKAYFELYPDYLNRSDIYFFFDEIHEISGWEKFIRRLLDREKMKIIISGSSCKMLSKEIASSLRGRTIAKEIFPFSFREYLQRQNVSIPKLLGSKQKIEMAHHLSHFLRWGGFPETIGVSAEMHRTLLQGYVDSVIYRDIIDRYSISNSHALKQLLSHCLRNSATIFSVNKMYQTLKSMGYSIGKNTLYEYMSYFEDAYCIFSLNKFDLSFRKAAQSMKKIYTVDQGLITAFTMASDFDLAAQLETAVFSYLRRQPGQMYYYHTHDGREVDFLYISPDQSLHLIQVCLSLKNTDTRRREVDALTNAMTELNLTRGTIVTINEAEAIATSSGQIDCVPAWQFLINV